nr:unnamed protein product [Digitaria exilis]
MATPAAAGANGASDVSVQVSAAAATDASGGKWQKRERRLNRFVWVTASGEWAGNAFGALVFLWATGVLLGGFCPDLEQRDFRYATVIIFIEAFRIFSRNYKMDNQSLFGTTRALRWINVSFTRMLGRPQEGNEVVLIMGLWINLVNWLQIIGPMFMGILQAALLILMSKMQLQGDSQLTKRSRRRRRLQLGVVLIGFLIIYVLYLSRVTEHMVYPMVLITIDNYYSTPEFLVAWVSTEILTQVVAVLLLIFRPLVVSKLTILSTPWSRHVLSLAKVISALSLAFGLAVALWPPLITIHSDSGDGLQYLRVDPSSFITAFTVAVLSLGSLQTPAANNPFGGRFIDVILHILFLWYLLILVPAWSFRGLRGASLLTPLAAGLSAAVLLMENLQIPTAALQVLLSSSRFHGLEFAYKHHRHISKNMVPAIRVFYVLALCQGSLYIAASIVGLVSFFPRRSLVRHSKLSGQRGAKAIDVYYECSYSSCMETGLFAAGRTMSLASFATESLRSSSSEIRLAGILVLDNLLQDSSEELRSGIISSDNRTLMSMLVGMLGRTDVRHRDMRLIIARVIAKLAADSIAIAEVPGMLKSVSSLLDADNQPAKNESSRQDSLREAASVNGQMDQQNSEQTVPGSNNNGGKASGNQHTGVQLPHGRDDNGCCYQVSRWVRGYWHQLKEKYSILEEIPLTHQDSLPILGIVILERLARGPDNCAEIVRATYLISKIIGLISYTTDNENCNGEQQHTVIFSSLNFVRRLAITEENIGAALRQELCKNPFLLTNLECILEDRRSSPELMELVIEILTKLAFDEDTRKEIGSSKVTICKLMHAFIGKDGPTNNVCYDQSLRMAAGEALENLTVESPANCLAILEEMGYELIKDLKDMLCEVEYRYVAASILQNFCAHSMDKLRHHQGARDHLSSALPMYMV